MSWVTQKRLFSSPLGTGREVEAFSQNRQITVFISFRFKRRLALLTDWKVTSYRQGIHTPLLMRRIFCPFVLLQIVLNWPIVVDPITYKTELLSIVHEKIIIIIGVDI